MFDPFSIDLPIRDIIKDIKEYFNDDNTLIINAPAGAGKSTLLPLALLNEGWLENRKIIMLEPRRLAAKSIATRMSDLIGSKVGDKIGYRIRFDNCVSKDTVLEVVTEGILTRMMHSDSELKDVAMVIFDEFHERSIHADVALALSRECQQVLRPDLKIMIMSATLNMPQLESLLKCSSVTSSGRMYSVENIHEGDTDEWMIPEQTVKVISKAVKKHDGDTLVFLPGQGEILKTQELLEKQLKNFVVMPLYGSMPIKAQQAAIFPNKSGKRKVVLATSIAETSLTIEGIKIVVDCGFGRTSKFDPRSGLTGLKTVQISKDQADQRAGRAGRLSEGVCYRMWSQATHNRMQDHLIPEILETDLASLVLDMSLWGITNVEQMTWLTPPPKGAVFQATDLLIQLGALEDGKITEHGHAMAKLPCHPRIGHMLIMAEEQGQLTLATDLAAILEERDPLGREAGIDINNRVNALRYHRRENRSGGRMGKITKVADSYLKLFDLEPDNEDFDPFESGILLSHAYPERIAHARPGNNAQFKLSNGKIAAAGHKDDLAHEAWLAVAHLDDRDNMGKIFLAAPLNPRDLAPLVKEKKAVKWDTEDGGLVANLELRIGNIVLQSKPLPDPDESQLEQAIVDAIKEQGRKLLNFNDEVIQWQNRVLSLRKWQPEAKWPDVSTSSLLVTARDWLSPYLAEIRKPHQLRKLDLKQILHSSLDYDKQQDLDTLAPDRIEVPSGSKLKIEYQANGEPPVLAVRIQEIFGLEETPNIFGKKVSVLLHLLSPGFKPVQVTNDLKSFWNNTYFEVRKELKRRYPKHVWPDDPIAEPPIRGVKKKK